MGLRRRGAQCGLLLALTLLLHALIPIRVLGSTESPAGASLESAASAGSTSGPQPSLPGTDDFEGSANLAQTAQQCAGDSSCAAAAAGAVADADRGTVDPAPSPQAPADGDVGVQAGGEAGEEAAAAAGPVAAAAPAAADSSAAATVAAPAAPAAALVEPASEPVPDPELSQHNFALAKDGELPPPPVAAAAECTGWAIGCTLGF